MNDDCVGMRILPFEKRLEHRYFFVPEGCPFSIAKTDRIAV
jgi:hypothetical protein